MKLNDWLNKENIANKEFAYRIRVTNSWVSRVRCEKAEPSLFLAALIHNETKGEVTFKDMTRVIVRESFQ